MLTAKSILIIETQGKEMERFASTVSAEDMPMLTAEVKLCLVQFLNSFNRRNITLNGKDLITHISVKGRDNVSEKKYHIVENTGSYDLMREGKKMVIKKEEIEMKKEVQVEQVEFDLNVGMEQAAPAVEAPVKDEDTEKAETATQVTRELMKKMKDAGVDTSNQAAVVAFITGYESEIKKMAKEIEETKPFVRNAALNPEVHTEFEAVLTKLGMFGDNHIHAALMTFLGKGEAQKEFTLTVLKTFEQDRKVYGQYFRNALGKKSPESSLVKNTAYVTADTFRSTGDLIETGVTKAVQALNKYVFHMVAKVIEAPVGGRPEEIKDYNFVNDAAGRVWDKVKPEPKKEIKA